MVFRRIGSAAFCMGIACPEIYDIGTFFKIKGIFVRSYVACTIVIAMAGIQLALSRAATHINGIFSRYQGSVRVCRIVC